MHKDWVGRVIDGRFPLLEWLGGSASGDVFLTELERGAAQKAAIKLIPADAEQAQAHIAGWAAAATLVHPHLMRLFHTGRCQIDTTPHVYAVMEYAEENLSQILPERPLTPLEAREMLDPVLDALSYLHARGFIHGQLKPSNLLVVDDQLKLSSDRLHLAGEPGKDAATAYDAPEGNAGTLSSAADIWSLGVTLVEALTQHPPLWDRSKQVKRTHGDPVMPESMAQPFAGIARECLRSDPARRATLSHIKALLASPPSSPSSPSSLHPASKTGRGVPGRFRVPALIAGVLILLAAIAISRLHSRPAHPSLQAATDRTGPAIAALPPPSAASPVPTSPFPISKGPVKGSVVERVLPDVPRNASQTIHGKIRVKVRVSADPSGEVSDVAMVSPGSSKYFANLALAAARRWKFKPAQVDGRAVPSVWILQFQFAQTATDVTAGESSP